jgi:hypothetical protein
MIYWELGVDRFHVIENIHDNSEFDIEYLRIDIEDDVIMFIDRNNILLHNNSMLSGFIKHHVKHIYKHRTDKSFHYELVFRDGNILITL